MNFNEYNKLNKINESVEMDLYTAIVDGVNNLREIYGDKELNKTGVTASLEKINRMILTAKKENEPKEEKEAQPAAQPAAQPMAQPMAQEQPETEEIPEETPSEEENDAAAQQIKESFLAKNYIKLPKFGE